MFQWSVKAAQICRGSASSTMTFSMSARTRLDHPERADGRGSSRLLKKLANVGVEMDKSVSRFRPNEGERVQDAHWLRSLARSRDAFRLACRCTNVTAGARPSLQKGVHGPPSRFTTALAATLFTAKLNLPHLGRPRSAREDSLPNLFGTSKEFSQMSSAF